MDTKRSATRARPSPGREARAYALAQLDAAIGQYQRTAEWTAAACRVTQDTFEALSRSGAGEAEACDGIDPYERWQDVAIVSFHAARSALVRALLTWHGASNEMLIRPEKRVFVPCAIARGGTVYLATPEPDNDMPPGSGGDPGGLDLMHLITFPAARLAVLDDAPLPH